MAATGADMMAPHTDHRGRGGPGSESEDDRCRLRVVQEVGSALAVIGPGGSAACLSRMGSETAAACPSSQNPDA